MESLLEQTDRVRQKGRCLHRWMNRIFLILISAILIGCAIRYYYPYEEGIKSGKLYYIVYKGLVFKTYEGKLIPSGSKSPQEEFIFSIAEKTLAETLMHAGGKTVELHYTEYFGAIPWRGSSRYIVDKIISIPEEVKPLDIDDAIVDL